MKVWIGVLFVCTLIVSTEVSAMGSQEAKINLGRIAVSPEGNGLLFDNKGGTYTLDLDSQEIRVEREAFSLIFSADQRYQIGTFVSEIDKKRILRRNASVVANPKSYSGIVIFRDHKEISRFETDGFCSDPFLDSNSMKVYYRKSMNKKELFGSEQGIDPLAGNDLFENTIDGKAERRLTFLNTTISQITFSPVGNELVFCALDRSSDSFSLRRLSLASGTVSDFGTAFSGFSLGDLSIAATSELGAYIILQREKKQAGFLELRILKVAQDGKVQHLGGFKDNTLSRPEYQLTNLVLNEKQSTIAFLMEMPLGDSGQPSFRSLFMASLDGSNFREVVLDLTTMRARSHLVM